jgi:imidazole glycerol-phosphate synthase subunit HisH
MSSVVIVDYEMGNLRSVAKALERAGAAVRVTQDPAEVRRADRLILPGVGAFPDAMTALRTRGLDLAVKDFVATSRPFLGICLGLQLLCDVGLEGRRCDGLGLMPGQCLALPTDLRDAAGRRLKVPHMGWNSLQIVRPSPLFKGVPDGSQVYFVHSFVATPSDPAAWVSTRTDYGESFTSSVWRDNIYATQFHPEKSQLVGLRLLENFVKL